MYKNVTSVETRISTEFWSKNRETSEIKMGILTTQDSDLIICNAMYQYSDAACCLRGSINPYLAYYLVSHVTFVFTCVETSRIKTE